MNRRQQHKNLHVEVMRKKRQRKRLIKSFRMIRIVTTTNSFAQMISEAFSDKS